MAASPSVDPKVSRDPNGDLGLGGRLEQSTARMLNRDGSSNVVRGGLEWYRVFHPYHYALTRSWPAFFGEVFVLYLLVNMLFAMLYVACGPGAIGNSRGTYLDAFFFSVQTLATIGYGKMTPENLAANILVSIESLLGLLGLALVTGILFARFSRPSAFLVFSDRAVIAPYQNGRGLMFRMANGRRANLSDLRATMTLILRDPVTGKRAFHSLALERDRAMFLALQWVVVHPIVEGSPLAGMSEERFYEAEPEVLVMISAVDEAFFQTASRRTSYKSREVIWGAKFRDIYELKPDGRMFLDVRRLSETDSISVA